MVQSPKVISIQSRKPRPPVPLTVILGMPEGRHSVIVREWMRSRPERRTVYLAPSTLEDPDTDECPQCILLRETLAKLEETLNHSASEIEGIWLEAPVELDPRKLVEELTRLSSIRIDAVTSWIDCTRFLQDFTSTQEWKDRVQGTGLWMSSSAQNEPVLETWIDQLEFCNAHLLMGMDELPPEEQDLIRSILETLHPEAIRLHAENWNDWAQRSFSWKLFDAGKIYSSCAWKKTLETKPDSPQFFRSKRPFHPIRLNSLIDQWPETILRSFGTVWLASHNDLALTLSQTGPAGFFFSPEGYWIGTLGAEDRGFAFQEHPELLRDWDQKFGDRVTELAFVSREPLGRDWIERLEACLLNDIEMRMDWSKFQNPFPTFDDEEGLEHQPTEHPHHHEKPTRAKKTANLQIVGTVAGDSEGGG